MKLLSTIRIVVSVIIYDVWRHLKTIAQPSQKYLAISNRSDVIHANAKGAVKVDGDYTSELTSARFFPFIGQKLMARSLKEHPIVLKSDFKPSDDPVVSVIIGHRGSARLPHLLMTLESIAAQIDVALEIIVVEQDHKPLIMEHLPKWVQYAFIQLPKEQSLYNRSWAFNVGARQASANTVLLHDNDLLVPQTYCKDHVSAINSGFDVANLKRFIFYSTENTSQKFLTSSSQSISDLRVESVLQNARGGGSIAVRKDFYLKIGGFDEDFVGWGGEDNEFWQRCESGNVDYYGYLPLLHLWHPAQTGKRAINGMGAKTASLALRKMAYPVHERIEILTQRNFGNPLKYQ